MPWKETKRVPASSEARPSAIDLSKALESVADTRFVGRHSELDTVSRLGARAEQGHGQLAALLGEAGIGNPRLLQFIARVSSDDEVD